MPMAREPTSIHQRITQLVNHRSGSKCGLLCAPERDDRVVCDVDVLWADLGAALGHVA